MRPFESVIALALLVFILPLMAIGWVGLLLVGARPIFVKQEIVLQESRARLLAFNATSSRFGLWLRRMPPTAKLPALFQVLTGEIRLGTCITWINQR